jgi:magnesium transporter
MLRALCRGADGGWVEVGDFASVSDLVAAHGQLVWAQANLEDLNEENIARIAEELELHPLAVEDAMRPRQRPKLELYENHLFFVAHQLDEVDDQLEAKQIASFVGKRFVLTVHQNAERTLDEAMRRLVQSSDDDARGPSQIVRAILDAVVDDYQSIADRLEQEIETLEDEALRDPRALLQNRVYAIKQQTARLRRYVLPGERVLADVVSGRTHVATERTRAFFVDIHDHLLRIGDEIRNVDDLANALVELQRAEQTNALNEVTKRLTGWAAVIAIPTLIASIYGMNFPLYPSNSNRYGFWIALGMMSASGLTLYAYFKRRGWI